MKKIMFVLLLCVTVMTAACGRNSQSAAEPAETAVEAAEPVVEAEEAAGKEAVPESVESLPEEKEELTLDMLLEIAARNAFATTDFHAFSNGMRKNFADAQNYYISFPFAYGGDSFILDASHWKDTDKLLALYLRRESNQEMILLYDAEGRYTTDTDVQGFLEYAYDIHDDISYEIPEGLTEEDFTANSMYAGCCLLKPDAYEPHGDFCTAEWYSVGSVSRFYVERMIEWEGDKIGKVDLMMNHTSTEYFGSLEGLCAPAYLIKCNHDLFTASEYYDLEQQGEDMEQIETTSDYWYVFLARPGDEFGYVISLNARDYSEEDVIAFAKTVKYLK